MTDRHRILYYEPDSHRGGAVQSLKVLLRHLDDQRFIPIVAFGGPFNPSSWPALKLLRVRFAPLCNYDFTPAGWTIPWVYHFLIWAVRLPVDCLRAVYLLRKTRPALVHINGGQVLSLGLACRILQIPVVWHIRELVCRNRLGRFQDCVYASCSARVVAISKAVAARLPRSARHLSVVANAVDDAQPGAADIARFRDRLGLESHHFCVLLLGNFTMAKGYAFFADVAAQLCDLPLIRLLIAGDYRDPSVSWCHRLCRLLYRRLRRCADEKQMIRRRWARAPLDTHAVLTGYVDAATAISACDLVVCPNVVSEPFGRTVIEAYAQGKPVIASSIEAFDETVLHGQSGWLLPPHVETWAEHIRDLYHDPQRTREMGRRAKRQMPAYTAAFHAQRIMTLYDELLPAVRDEPAEDAACGPSAMTTPDR